MWTCQRVEEQALNVNWIDYECKEALKDGIYQGLIECVNEDERFDDIGDVATYAKWVGKNYDRFSDTEFDQITKWFVESLPSIVEATLADDSGSDTISHCLDMIYEIGSRFGYDLTSLKAQLNQDLIEAETEEAISDDTYWPESKQRARTLDDITKIIGRNGGDDIDSIFDSLL